MTIAQDFTVSPACLSRHALLPVSGAPGPACTGPETNQASHRRRDAVAADRDGGRFERAVLLLVGSGDEDFGAGLEFALVGRHVGHDGRVWHDHDLLLS